MLEHIGEVMGTCLHCGMCLPVCPTYEMTNDERSSPRGRIRLLRSVLDGSLDPGADFAHEMNFCLDCRACETACPAGVGYGEVVEHGRNVVAERGLEPLSIRVKKFVVLRIVFGTKQRFDLFMRALRFYRRSGLREALERSGLLELLPRGVARLFTSLPDAADESFTGGLTDPPAAAGHGKLVGLVTGCIMNSSFPEVHRDTVALLQRGGSRVAIPPGQFCCGSLHGHNGDAGRARELAAGLMRLFPEELDAVIVNSAGCGSFMKQYGVLFRDDPAMAGRAESFAAKVTDATEYLCQGGLPPRAQRGDVRVTYHDACHLLHGQHISAEPRALLRSIPGVDLVELPDSSRCCGSAGIYNILRPEDSAALMKRKVANILSTGASVVSTANPGCHLQIERGLREAGSDVVVRHPLTLLNAGSRTERGR